MASGVSSENHPIKLPADHPGHCIVWGSHALMKLPYWDESGFKHPDPMHTISNEVATDSDDCSLQKQWLPCEQWMLHISQHAAGRSYYALGNVLACTLPAKVCQPVRFTQFRT